MEEERSVCHCIRNARDTRIIAVKDPFCPAHAERAGSDQPHAA